MRSATIDPKRIKLYKRREIRPYQFHREMVASVKKHGIMSPLHLTGGLRLLDGYARLQAAIKCGITKVSVIIHDSVEVEKRGGSCFLLTESGDYKITKKIARKINECLFGRAHV